jgi:hypothetical protein
VASSVRFPYFPAPHARRRRVERRAREKYTSVRRRLRQRLRRLRPSRRVCPVIEEPHGKPRLRWRPHLFFSPASSNTLRRLSSLLRALRKKSKEEGKTSRVRRIFPPFCRHRTRRNKKSVAFPCSAALIEMSRKGGTANFFSLRPKFDELRQHEGSREEEEEKETESGLTSVRASLLTFFDSRYHIKAAAMAATG